MTLCISSRTSAAERSIESARGFEDELVVDLEQHLGRRAFPFAAGGGWRAWRA